MNYLKLLKHTPHFDSVFQLRDAKNIDLNLDVLNLNSKNFKLLTLKIE